MKLSTGLLMVLLTGSAAAIAPEKAEIGRSGKHLLRPAEVSERQSALRQSEAAFALATANLGNFQDPRINSLSNRIQDDQRVIIRTLGGRTATVPTDPLDARDYVERQIELHEELLRSLKESDSPVLRNMISRVETILENARSIKDETLEAQESTAPPKHPLSRKKLKLKKDKI